MKTRVIQKNEPQKEIQVRGSGDRKKQEKPADSQGGDKKQAGRQAKAKATGAWEGGDRGWGKGQGTSQFRGARLWGSGPAVRAG